MDRSLIEHEIELTLYVYEVFIRPFGAENFHVGWRIGKEAIESPKRISPNQKGRIVIDTQFTMRIKMAYDLNTESYRDKKGFLMLYYNGEKSEGKLAGFLALNVAKQLTDSNKQKQIMIQDYTLQKCPDKTAAISIGFRWRILNENSSLNRSYFNESTISLMSDHRPSQQVQQIQKQNQGLKSENLSLRNQVGIFINQIKNLMSTKQQLEKQNQNLRSHISQIQANKNNNNPSDKWKNIFSDDDMQDMRSLDIIKEECLKLQAMKTQESESYQSAYKQEISAKQLQITKLNHLIDHQTQKIESLQYLNNLLIKQQETKLLRINKLEEEIQKMNTLLQDMTVSKEEVLNVLNNQLIDMRDKNGQLVSELQDITNSYNLVSQQLQAIKVSSPIQQTLTSFPVNPEVIKQRKSLSILISVLRNTQSMIYDLKKGFISQLSQHLKSVNHKDILSRIRRIQNQMSQYLGIYASY